MSCNGAFDTIAQTLNQTNGRSWQRILDTIKVTEVRWISRTKRANFDIASDDSVWSRMQLAIGQGTTTVTPLLNLMMYAAIANDGVMMTPYLVDHYLDADGNVDKEASRRVEVKFRLKDDEMIEELSKIMAGSEESAADTATEAGADAAAN